MELGYVIVCGTVHTTETETDAVGSCIQFLCLGLGSVSVIYTII